MSQLLSQQARFYYDTGSTFCVDPRYYEQEKNKAVTFSRCIEVTALSRNDVLDVKLGITEKQRSISNCPYKLTTLIHDQGLDCFFGHRDHRERND